MSGVVSETRSPRDVSETRSPRDVSETRSPRDGADWLPDAHWGTAETPLPDWRQAPDDPDPDDEELPETPPDVVAMLGFDPKGEVGAA